jgi:hypothetical protein
MPDQIAIIIMKPNNAIARVLTPTQLTIAAAQQYMHFPSH